MLMALLRGKLSREQENLEDILTSNVFGLLKYLPPEEGLFPFLSHAQTLDGRRPLEGAVPGAKVEYQFWPWYAEEDCNACEIVDPGPNVEAVFQHQQRDSHKESPKIKNDSLHPSILSH